MTMSAHILDGKELAKTYSRKLESEVAELKAQGVRPRIVERRVLRIQFRAFDAMGGISVQGLPKRDQRCERDKCAAYRSEIERRLLHFADFAGARSVADLARRRSLASRPLGRDRRDERPEIVLGVGASAG